MKTGLILEGGAMRGLFSCGVMDVLMENGIAFDGAAGISAGAVFGCNYKSGQAGRALRYNLRFSRDRRYCSLWSLLTTGDLYGADFCYRELPEELDVFDRAAFAQNPMEFYVGAMDVNTGEPVFHLCADGGTEDLQWMRASASMPALSRPVALEGRLLLDGGIVDPIPFRFMEDKGYHRCVAILTQPADYRKQPSGAARWMRLLLRRYPRVAEAMEVRHQVYNRQMEEIARREAAGALLVIRPPASLGISRTEKEPQELKRVYQIGRAEGQKRLEEIKRFLQG